MYRIEIITDRKLKSTITEEILRGLPEWFGIEESILDYMNKVQDMFFVGVYSEDEVIGFLSIEVINKYTIEVYVTGIKKAFHRKGIGKDLIKFAEQHFSESGYMFMMVKTLGESANYEFYDKTRNFYRGVGFLPLQEIKEIWGADNPCLIMVKTLLLGKKKEV